MLPLSRVLQATVVLVAATTLLMITEVSAVPTTPSLFFPSYVRQAMDVVAKTTSVPVLGPVWLPNTKVSRISLMPLGGTFAATVQATSTRYQMNFWVEAHALPVNSPKVTQDSEDPNTTPIAIVSGQRYTTRAQAKLAVWHGAMSEFVGLANLTAIPKNAHPVTITATQSGDVWIAHDYPVIAWRERGWLLVTAPTIVPSHHTAWVAAAVTTARLVVSKVRSPMPGQFGTIAIDVGGDGIHTTARWQRGRIVYSVFANYGVSSATTVVGSLYPMPRE